MSILVILLDQTPRGAVGTRAEFPMAAGTPGPREVSFSKLRIGDVEIKTSGAEKGIVIPKEKLSIVAKFLNEP